MEVSKVARRSLAAGSLVAVLASCTGSGEKSPPPPPVATTTSSPQMGPHLPDILLSCQSDGKMSAIPPELVVNNAKVAERLGVTKEAVERGVLASAHCEQGVKPADVEAVRAKAVIKGLGGLSSPCLVSGVIETNVNPSAPPLTEVPHDKLFHDIYATCAALPNGSPVSSEAPPTAMPAALRSGTGVNPSF